MRYLTVLAAISALGVLIMGSAAHAQGRIAPQACGRWAEDPDPAIEACTDFLKNHCGLIGGCPLDQVSTGAVAGAYIDRGFAYANIKGDYRRAIADFSEAIKILPSDFTHRLNPAFAGRAFAYIGLGQYDQAIASIDEYFSKVSSFKEGPVYSESMLVSFRGIAYSRKGAYERALADFNASIKLASREPLAYMERGTAYTGKGWHERALADHDEAIRLDPTNLIAYVRRGQTWEAKGERERAIEDYNKAVSFRAKFQWERDEQAVARRRLAALKSATSWWRWFWGTEK